MRTERIDRRPLLILVFRADGITYVRENSHFTVYRSQFSGMPISYAPH